MTLPTASTPIGEFRMVTVHWLEEVEDGHVDTHVVHMSQIDLFVEAMKKLHFSPGVNPHNGGSTSVIGQIDIAPIVSTGPFWWTGPSLRDDNGATIFQGGLRTVAWRHPLVIERDRAAMEEELRMEEACEG